MGLGEGLVGLGAGVWWCWIRVLWGWVQKCWGSVTVYACVKGCGGASAIKR